MMKKPLFAIGDVVKRSEAALDFQRARFAYSEVGKAMVERTSSIRFVVVGVEPWYGSFVYELKYLDSGSRVMRSATQGALERV